MVKTRQRRWHWIVARLPRGASIRLGKPGRRLTIGRYGVSIQLGQRRWGLTLSWRRSWRDLLRRRRSGAHSRSPRRS